MITTNLRSPAGNPVTRMVFLVALDLSVHLDRADLPSLSRLLGIKAEKLKVDFARLPKIRAGFVDLLDHYRSVSRLPPVTYPVGYVASEIGLTPYRIHQRASIYGIGTLKGHCWRFTEAEIALLKKRPRGEHRSRHPLKTS